MKKTIKIRDKQTSIPLVQGGMGVGVSLGRLAGTIAKLGGIGTISTAQIGYREPDFEAQPWEANFRAIGKEMKKARAISKDGIVAFNIMVALKHYAEQVKAAAKAGADLIVSGAGLPMDLPEYLQGTDTAFAPIVSSAKAANIILRKWDRKYQCTADMIVIEGPKAGGHLGFHTDQIQEFQDKAYEEEIHKILEVVQQYEDKYGRHIPVVFGGGLNTPEAVSHAMSLGVDGVQVASAFIPTEECDADIRYKEAYTKISKQDIQLIHSPVGLPGRAIRNEFVKKLEKGVLLPVKKCYGCLRKCDPKTIPYCITQRLIEAARGNVEEGLLFCGANADTGKKIQKAEQVVSYLLG